MNPLTWSRWLLGAALSLLALIGHGSGAVNLDGLNPLLVVGCAHQPSSRLMLRNRVDDKRSIALKKYHAIRLVVSENPLAENPLAEGKNSVVVGKFLHVVSEAPRAGAAVTDDLLATPTGARGPIKAIAIRMPGGSVRQIPVGVIRMVSFRQPGDGWKYAKVGALIGAVPTSAFGAALFSSFPGSSALDTMIGVVVCAPIGALPGAFFGGVVNSGMGPNIVLKMGPDWELQ